MRDNNSEHRHIAMSQTTQADALVRNATFEDNSTGLIHIHDESSKNRLLGPTIILFLRLERLFLLNSTRRTRVDGFVFEEESIEEQLDDLSTSENL